MKERIIAILKDIFGAEVPIELSVPEEELFGHYSTNIALRQAKMKGVSPLELAKEYAAKIAADAPAGFFHTVEAAAPGFVNFWLSNETMQAEFARLAADKHYGAGRTGKGKTVIVEYSAPNIAKLMHVGHLRNTIIGDALANILQLLGYKVIRWNYLGDWGTQFGKIIAAYKLWGDKKRLSEKPIEEMQELYVRFHKEMASDPSLERRGQEEFRKLEEGDRENERLWNWFRKESVKELKRTYGLFTSADFDVWIGESFFDKEMKPLVKELVSKGIAVRSEGAIVVHLEDAKLPPAMIEKSDGASLYLTRDIANLRYRIKKYRPHKILYVIGNEQSLHFEQLFAIAKLLGFDGAELTHIKYGLVLGERGKKLSTREGTAELLKDLLDEALVKAREVIEVKSPGLTDKEKTEIAMTVGLGALKYNDLKENRTTDIIFNWEKMLDFSGDSAPYLQYTYARLKSIIRKSKVPASRIARAKNDVSALDHTSELALMRRIFEFPDAVERSGALYSTSTLAVHLYRLAVAANKFYETMPILKDEDVARRNARLLLAATAARTLDRGLALLGIRTLEKI